MGPADSNAQGPPVVATAGLPQPPLPLMKVHCSTKYCMRPDSRPIGSPLPRRPGPFGLVPCGLSPSAVRHKLALMASSSRELSASYRVLRLTTCPLFRGSAFLGVLSLIATSASGVTSAREPTPEPTYRPQRFSRSRRLCPTTSLAGLFHPAATSRVCPPGVCSSPRSRTGFPRPGHALLPLDEPACGVTPAPANPPSPSGPCSPQ